MNPETEFREGLDELAVHYKEVLKLLGEDPEREGLVKTPMRVAKAMQVLTRGYTQDPHKVLTDALFAEKYDQMVIVKDIDFFSIACCRDAVLLFHTSHLHAHMLGFYDYHHALRFEGFLYAVLDLLCEALLHLKTMAVDVHHAVFCSKGRKPPIDKHTQHEGANSQNDGFNAIVLHNVWL